MKKILLFILGGLLLFSACKAISTINDTVESQSEDLGLATDEDEGEKDQSEVYNEVTGDESEKSEELFFEVREDEFSKINKLDDEKEDSALARKLEIDPSMLYSKNVYLVDFDENKPLYSLKENEVVYPASLTKIMTTLIGLEECRDKNQEFALDEDAYYELIMEDASMAGFIPNEGICFEDLLYGTMMPSGADASIGLSVLTSGSEEGHVVKMNKLAEKMGLKNTHFANVTGLFDEKNYSSAKDLGKLMVYAMDNEEFRKIITSPYHVTKETPDHPDGIYLSYSVVDYANDNYVEDYKILGGKTGFIEEAGFCLASVAEINGKNYILVSLGADHNKGHFMDAITIYNEIYKETTNLASS